MRVRLALLVLSVVACSGASDPVIDQGAAAGDAGLVATTPTLDASSGAQDATGVGVDATTPHGDDGGGVGPLDGDPPPDAPPPTDSGPVVHDAATDGVPFLGLPPYKSSPVAVSAQAHHFNAGESPVYPGTDCFGCHTSGGHGAPFFAAGWVASAPNGTTGAADVEVGVYPANFGAALSAHTDADGYFWIPALPGGGASGPFSEGVRAYAAVTLAQSPTTSAACPSCHATGSPIHYP